MIELPKSLTIDACEKFLAKLAESTSDENLLLPVGTAKYAFGGLAAAIQIVNTWARISNVRKLELRQSEQQDEITELIIKPHKFSAAMLAKSIIRSNEEIDLRTQVNSVAKTAIEDQGQSKFGQQHGRLCWFAFIDHSSKGFDKNFYIEGQLTKAEPRQPAQFQAVIHAMIDKSMSVSGGAKPLERDCIDNLGRIFYELFLNTHEHGTRGYSRSEWLKPGMRIMYTQGINLTEEGVEGFTKKQPVLSTYLNSVAEQQNTNNQKRFVEISIVDSGLGYCGRWQADHKLDEVQGDLSLADEYTIFKRCFAFRQSSSFQPNKGLGLPVVMDRLTKLNGFMRIRSGRLALFRDFIESPYQPDDGCSFSDWSSRKSAEEILTPMPPVTGVAITLLIPLEAKQ